MAAPDPFTATSSSVKDGSRKIGENKLLSRPGSSRNRFQVKYYFNPLEIHSLSLQQPYQAKCKDCKQPTTQNKAKYCHGVWCCPARSLFFLMLKLQVVLSRKDSAQYVARRSWTHRGIICPVNKLDHWAGRLEREWLCGSGLLYGERQVMCSMYVWVYLTTEVDNLLLFRICHLSMFAQPD